MSRSSVVSLFLFVSYFDFWQSSSRQRPGCHNGRGHRPFDFFDQTIKSNTTLFILSNPLKYGYLLYFEIYFWVFRWIFQHQRSLCVRLPSGQLAHVCTTLSSQRNSIPQTQVTSFTVIICCLSTCLSICLLLCF